jgi:hypothetical protein
MFYTNRRSPVNRSFAYPQNSVTYVQLAKIGTLLLLLVPGCAGLGDWLGGMLALLLGKGTEEEETWSKRGKAVLGLVGFGGWIGASWGILSS